MTATEIQAVRRFTEGQAKVNRALVEFNRRAQRDLPRFQAAVQNLRMALDRSYSV